MPDEIVPQGAAPPSVVMDLVCTSCGHTFRDHPAVYPNRGTPSLPCKLCDCKWFDDRCKTCGQTRPCEHWPG